MVKWSGVLADSEYQGLPDDQKSVVKQRYFDKVISQDEEYKVLPENDRAGLKNRFFGIPVSARVPASTGVLSAPVEAPPQPASVLPPGGGLHPLPDVTNMINYPAMEESVSPQAANISSIPYQPPENIPTPEEQRASLTQGVVASHNLMAGNLIPQIGEAAYLPAKYLIEKPLAAAFGGNNYEDLAKKMGFGKWGSVGVSTVARMLSSGAFWWGAGELMSLDPKKYFLGDQELRDIRSAMKKGDYGVIADYLQNNPDRAKEAFNTDSIKSIMDMVKAKDPESYKNIYRDLFAQRMTGEAPANNVQTTPEPTVPVQPIVPYSPQGIKPQPPQGGVPAPVDNSIVAPPGNLPMVSPKPSQTAISAPITPSAPGANEAMSKFTEGQLKARETAAKINAMMKGEVSELTPKDREWLSFMKSDVEQGQAGYWGKWDTQLDKFSEGTGGISTYPEWMQNQGLTKDHVLRVIEKMENGEPFTPDQPMQKRVRDHIRQELDHFQEEELANENAQREEVRLEWSMQDNPKQKIMAEPGQPAIQAQDLAEGQKFDINGEEFTVKKDGGIVYLKDGETITLNPGEAVNANYLQEGEVYKHEPVQVSKTQETAPQSNAVSEAIRPESVPGIIDERGSVIPSKFAMFKHTYSPVATEVDSKINEKAAQDYGAKKNQELMVKSFPDEQVRQEKFLHLVNGGIPRDATEKNFMDNLKAWGERGVKAGSFEAVKKNYVPYGLKNDTKEINNAFNLLNESDQARIEGVDPRFSRYSGHFQKRKSENWTEYVNRIDKINSLLKSKGSEIILEPETDLAKVQYNYEKTVSQKILNQELMTWLEGYHNPVTGKIMLKLARNAWGDPDYSELSNKVNVKIKWSFLGDDPSKLVPLKYFVHKDFKNAINNYLEGDLLSDSKTIQHLNSLNDVIKRVKLFNPAVIIDKMVTRSITTQGVTPLLNLARLKTPWSQGAALLKQPVIMKEAIRDGLSIWEETNKLGKAPIKQNIFEQHKTLLEKIPGIELNDRIVQHIIQATRVQLWHYIKDDFIEKGFSRDQAGRMAAKMANDITYARLRHEMSGAMRTIGKGVLFSRNGVLGELAIGRRLAGGGPSIFTDAQVKSMSQAERFRLVKLLFFFGILPMALNIRVTGRYVNTEKGYRGKTGIYKDDKTGKITYVNTLDYGQDLINVLTFQWDKLMGKISPPLQETVSQIGNQNIFTHKKITGYDLPSLNAIKDRGLHTLRAFTPGQDTIFWAEKVPEFAASLKAKGWEKTFKDISPQEWGDFIIPLFGKWPSHGLEGAGIIARGLDEQNEEKKNRRETVTGIEKTEGRKAAYKYLRDQGLDHKEAIQALKFMGRGNPLSGLFHGLSKENKRKKYLELKNSDYWKNIPPEVKKDLLKQTLMK